MKRLIAPLLAIALLLGLAGCSESDDTPAAASDRSGGPDWLAMVAEVICPFTAGSELEGETYRLCSAIPTYVYENGALKPTDYTLYPLLSGRDTIDLFVTLNSTDDGVYPQLDQPFELADRVTAAYAAGDRMALVYDASRCYLVHGETGEEVYLGESIPGRDSFADAQAAADAVLALDGGGVVAIAVQADAPEIGWLE